MIYRKPNGDLNLDIDAVLEKYPELAGATDDDAEQKVISVALVPYLIMEMQKTKREQSIMCLLVMIMAVCQVILNSL